MKKEDLKLAYDDPTPEFHNNLLRILNSLTVENNTNAKRVKRKAFRIAVAFAMVILIGTMTVVASAVIYNTFVNRVGNYSVEISPVTENVEQPKKSPDYARLNIGYLPKDIVKADETGIKYYKTPTERCIAFMLFKADNDYKFSELFVNDYEEVDLKENEGVILNIQPYKNNDETARKVFYIHFKEMGVILKGNVTNDISDDEIKNIMENISVTPEKKLGDDILYVYDEDINNNEETECYGMNYDYNVIDENKSIDFSNTNADYTGSVTFNSINILDNISNLDRESFYFPEFNNINEVFDENGDILPYINNKYSDGDGVNSIGQLTESRHTNRKFITANFTVSNTLDLEQTFNISQIGISILENDKNGKLKDREEKTSIDGEINYIDNNDVDILGIKSGYYQLTIPANSSKDITIGFLVDENTIDDLYIVVDNILSYSLSQSTYTCNVLKVR